jgi:hypothetical protein
MRVGEVAVGPMTLRVPSKAPEASSSPVASVPTPVGRWRLWPRLTRCLTGPITPMAPPPPRSAQRMSPLSLGHRASFPRPAVAPSVPCRLARSVRALCGPALHGKFLPLTQLSCVPSAAAACPGAPPSLVCRSGHPAPLRLATRTNRADSMIVETSLQIRHKMLHNLSAVVLAGAAVLAWSDAAVAGDTGGADGGWCSCDYGPAGVG